MKNSFLLRLFFCLVGMGFFVSQEAFSAEKPFIVVLDAGHGGKDVGAIGYTMKLHEKNINLSVALKLGAMLEKLDGVKVVYTRKKDVFIPLDDRAQIANKIKADLFISIHTNSAENRTAKGTESYAVGSSSSSLEVAKRENSVMLYEDDYKTKYQGFNPNSTESYIMFDFIQSKYLEQSVRFASFIENNFSSTCNRSSRGVKQAGFWVLKQTSMPAVLIELGYISNKEEEAFLSKDESLTSMSAAIYKAFLSYKSDHDKKNGVVVFKEVEESNLENSNKESEKKTEDELYYAVQFCSSSSSKPLDCRDFKGFVPAQEYIENGTYKYKYVYGHELTFEEGLKLRERVRNHFKDAFLVVIKNGEKLPTEEARKYYK